MTPLNLRSNRVLARPVLDRYPVLGGELVDFPLNAEMGDAFVAGLISALRDGELAPGVIAARTPSSWRRIRNRCRGRAPDCSAVE
jgi:hypothetical protein